MLLTKLQYYGIHGTALCLFESYLARREQHVCYTSSSSHTSINIGTTIIFTLGKLKLHGGQIPLLTYKVKH